MKTNRESIVKMEKEIESTKTLLQRQLDSFQLAHLDSHKAEDEKRDALTSRHAQQLANAKAGQDQQGHEIRALREALQRQEATLLAKMKAEQDADRKALQVLEARLLAPTPSERVADREWALLERAKTSAAEGTQA